MTKENGIDGGAKGDKLTVEKMYQKKSQLEHILLRPDTYIGSVETVTEQMWVYSAEDDMMVQREITYVPGLYKIFDEILVNAADNKQRDPKMDCIKIEINPEENMISVWNNGQGIPVVEHKDEKMFVPTMIFGHLLTSSNYNDEEEKVTGGRNGYGAKLCNIFSTKFTVETSSKQYKRAFRQTWTNNMTSASDVKLKDASGEDYTKIVFHPDLAKFKMEKLDDDIVSLLSRRAYDVAASTRGVKVFLNGTRIPIKTFKDYIDLYIRNKTDEFDNPLKVVYEQVNPRWEVGLTISDGQFQQVSFVNSIATTKGGRHVDYIAESLTKQLVDVITKKNKGGMKVRPVQVKAQMWLFVNCLIVNPTFDSQTKENMTLQSKSFGSKCTLSEKFMTSVVKSGLVEQVIMWAKSKAQMQLEKATGGKKKSKLKGIPKLEDANDAGTQKSHQCTLILTEGDSAKTLAVSGLGVVGRDKYGVFPLRGKLLNVREATHKQILDNAEIANITKIMGLQYKKKYETPEDMKTLRYGKLMIMTDQDQDGSHIKGLIVNYIHHNWPSLIKMPFLEVFITPIIKATKKNEELSFFSIPEFEEWKQVTPNHQTYRIKYYKGLGTSTSKEAKEYFSNMERHRIKFKYSGPECDQHIIMAFSKKCVDQRKEWLSNWMAERKRRKELGLPEEYLYTKDTRYITYKDFVNKELILFSNMDLERSIPSMVDGLKPGSRKVLFTTLKRNDKREIKVAQLAGSVAEHSAYHHGEQSLMMTIINLAQNFVGSNNINILQPIGQFGARLNGGKDAASPRYIFTMLSPLARLIFHPHDDPLLKYQRDDNQKIEPVWYCPIIPMLLVNGADGIGTGWMTRIPNYNPRELIENIRRSLNGGIEPLINLKPWYKNFKGEIEPLIDGKYIISGEVAVLNDEKVEITELPIGTWTQNYKESVLEVMLNGNEKTPAQISDYRDYSTDTTVKFIVTMSRDKLASAENEGLHKFFKLQTSVSLSSMSVFDKDLVLRQFTDVADIFREYFDVRLEYYHRRKAYLEGMLEAEALKLSNQARFIIEKCDGTLTIENKKKVKMVEELINKNFASDPVKAWKLRQIKEEDLEEEEKQEEEGEEEEMAPRGGPDFDYLLGMTMWSLTLERKDELIAKRNAKQAELKELQMKTPGEIWLEDLDALHKKLDEVEEKERQDEAAGLNIGTKAGKGGKGGAKGAAGGGAGKKKMVLAAEALPSPVGRRIKPEIDSEMKKKAEIAVRLKEKKLKGPSRRGDDLSAEKDEFDMIEEGAQKSVASKLGNSPHLIDKKMKEKKKEKQAKIKDVGEGGKKGRKKKEDGSPSKKKKKANPWSDSSDEDDGEMGFSDSDGDLRSTSTPAVPKRETSRRSAAANLKFSFDSEESEGFGTSSGDEKEKKPTKKTARKDFSSDEEAAPLPQKKPTSKPSSVKSGGGSSDSDMDFKPKSGASSAPISDDSDKIFDSLLSNSKPESTTPGHFDTFEIKSSDDDEEFKPKTKAAPAPKKPRAKKGEGEKKERKKKEPAAKKEKKPPAKRAKKKNDSSDSDDMFSSPPKSKKKKGSSEDEDDAMSVGGLSDGGGADSPPPPPRATTGRARKAISYKFDDDEDSDD